MLHIIKSFKLGGAETNLRNLIAAASEGVEPHVAYSVGGAFEDWFRNQDVALFKYAQCDHKVKSFATLAIVIRLAMYIRKEKIQIVHTHNYSSHVWGALAAKLSGAKVVEHVHDFRYEEPDYNVARGVNPSQFNFVKHTARLSDRLVVLTRNNEAFLRKHRIVTADKVRVMFNGIDTNNQAKVSSEAIREQLSIGLGRRVVLTAARISKEKNIGFVLDIVHLLRKSPDFDTKTLFLIAGDGPERAALEARVVDEGLSNVVRFIGFYPNVLELLAISEIFLQPTLLELHSITMLEAMVMDIPVLVSKDVGCNNEFITHGIDGFLLDPSNAEIWVEAILKLMADRNRAREIGKAGGVLTKKKCDINNTVEQMEQLYKELASNHA